MQGGGMQGGGGPRPQQHGNGNFGGNGSHGAPDHGNAGNHGNNGDHAAAPSAPTSMAPPPHDPESGGNV
jgi:hypothetical protein